MWEENGKHKMQPNARYPRGGQCVKKLRIYVRTTTILYGGITFKSLFFFTCYHYVIFYFGLIEKGLALLIIPNYLLFHTL